jgi:hypothetical protein
MSVCDPKVHDTRKNTPEWETWPFIGIQQFPDGRALECRNCTCGSTVTKPVETKKK